MYGKIVAGATPVGALAFTGVNILFYVVGGVALVGAGFLLKSLAPKRK